MSRHHVMTWQSVFVGQFHKTPHVVTGIRDMVENHSCTGVTCCHDMESHDGTWSLISSIQLQHSSNLIFSLTFLFLSAKQRPKEGLV